MTGLAPSPPEYETLKVLERDPEAPGVNVTVKVQELEVASEPPADAHEPAPEFVIAKSPEFPPVMLGETLVAVVELLFVTVNVTGELGLPTLNEPKFSLDGDNVTLVLAPYTFALNDRTAFTVAVPPVPVPRPEEKRTPVT
ncbi:MAG TPA: hypothetical protein VHX36_02720 [Candidatus Acidoferrales bacterium]|nr:hypothetical protein [Candidatus Acidoferrales bacterium]